MMICPECGAENPPESESCQRCSAVLSGGSNRLQWFLTGLLAIAVVALAAWRFGVFEKIPGREPEAAATSALPEAADLGRIPMTAPKVEGAGVSLEFPGPNWKVNGRDSPDKLIKNPAAEFEFVDLNSFAFGLLLVEDTQLSLKGYGDLALNQVKSRYTSFEISRDEAAVLGGEPARYVEFQVVSSEKVSFRYLTWYVIRGGKGYQLVFYTIPSLVEDLKKDTAQVVSRFRFTE